MTIAHWPWHVSIECWLLHVIPVLWLKFSPVHFLFCFFPMTADNRLLSSNHCTYWLLDKSDSDLSLTIKDYFDLSVLMTCLKNAVYFFAKAACGRDGGPTRWGAAGESEWLNARGKHLLSEGSYSRWLRGWLWILCWHTLSCEKASPRSLWGRRSGHFWEWWWLCPGSAC